MNHSDAKTLVDNLATIRSAPDPAKLSLLTRVVASLESNYGVNFYGNWGAITGKYLGQSFQHKDSRPERQPDGTMKQVEYVTDFRKYPSDTEAAEDLASLLQRKYSAAVDAVPFWDDVARELYGYYLGVGTREQAIAAWARRAKTVYASIAAATLENPIESLPPSTEPAPPVGGGSLLLALGGLLALGSYLLWRIRNG